MAFQIKHAGGDHILHHNALSGADLNSPQLQDEWMQFDHPHGRGQMKQWIFDGIRLGFSDWQVTQPTAFEWQGDLEVVTMMYCLKGRLSVGDQAQAHFALAHNQQNTFFGRAAAGTMRIDELGLQSFMLQFNKDAFLRIADGGTEALKRFAEQVAAGHTTVFSPQNLAIDPAARQAIDAILHCRFNDQLKKVFFLSKAMELLVLQADAQARVEPAKISHLKTDYDRERIIFARDYMLRHIDAPPSVPELARIAGINEFKLKKGYKETFGHTIFGHLAEARLERSRRTLAEGGKSVSEIALELGYASVQHFSQAFNKKFGLAPSRLKG